MPTTRTVPAFRISALVLCLIAAFASTAASVADEDPPIYRLDLSSLNQADLSCPDQARRAWDTVQVAATIQGNANRNSARLFLRCMPETDDFWWQELRREGGWLAGRKVIEITAIEDLLTTFADELQGVTLYREREPYASNIAATVAAATGRFVLRRDDAPGSVYRQLASHRAFPKDVFDVPEAAAGGFVIQQAKPTGSAKNDAYRWALANFLDDGKSGATDLAYFLDAWWLKHPHPAPGSLWNSTLANHDFYIAKRAFFFDLNPVPDETPVDDPGQRPGLDRETLQLILASMSRRAAGKIFAVGGFIPWAWKYVGPDGKWPGSGGKRHPVQCEWECTKLFSAYNGCKDADALGYSGMANASFYQHFPMRARYPQPRPDLTDGKLRNDGLLDEAGVVVPRQYFTWYCGDYDSSAWLNRFVPKLWADTARGTIPLNWAFNPSLARRAPHAMDYARTHATAADSFIAGDNGAGYLNPGMLTAPRLDPSIPDGWQAWIAHNKPWFERFDLTITGFVIDGFAPTIDSYGFAGYSEFSPGGIGTQSSQNPWGVSPEGIPYAWVRDVGHESQSPDEAVRAVLANVGPGLQFRILRTILNTPTWHREVMEKVARESAARDTRFVSAPVFFELLRRSQNRR